MAENKNLSEQKKPEAVATRRIGKAPAKSAIFLKLAKRFLAQFGTAILAIAIISYVFLQLMLNAGTVLATENAVYSSITDRSELEAFLFRDERLIPSTSSGTNCYLTEDGTKVRRGENIVVTYSDPADVEIQKRISEIDKRIDILEKSSLSTGVSTTNIKLIDDQIDELMLSIIRQVDANEFDKVLREKNELLILMNRRQAIIKEDSYAFELSDLYSERDQLNGSLSGARVFTGSPESGYFYSTIDGYENQFTLETLAQLTGEKFEKLAEAVPDESIISANTGKIVSSSTWYIAVAFDKRKAEIFRDGHTYPVTFQYSNNTEINMTLERRIARTDKDMTVLVFSTKFMPEGFDYSRRQTVEIPHAAYEGIRISSSALRMKDGVTGVYVVIGSKVVFKKTEVIYTYGRYSVCAIPKNPVYPDRRDIAYSSKTELSLHDAVVIDGTDIFDGMRII